MSVPHVPGRGKPMKRPFPPPTSGKPTGPLMPIRCPLPNHSNSGVPLKFGMGKEEDDRLKQRLVDNLNLGQARSERQTDTLPGIDCVVRENFQ
jgi:hypothetical protein